MQVFVLSAKMVGEEHFGGFLTKKQDEIGADGKPKSWKERMEEIIAKSKKEKVRDGLLYIKIYIYIAKQK